jgi:hypothetical protein
MRLLAMKTPKPRTLIHSMPLDELLEMLGATRQGAAQRTGGNLQRRRPLPREQFPRRSRENRQTPER